MSTCPTFWGLNCFSTLSMLKPDGSTSARTTIGASGGSLDPSMALPETGTYTVVVDPVGNNTGSMTPALSSPVSGTIALDGAPVTVSLNNQEKRHGTRSTGMPDNG